MNKFFNFAGIFTVIFLCVILSFSCSSAGSSSTPSPSSDPTPQFEPADLTMPDLGSNTINPADKTAAQIVDMMQFGWNLGNTLDANFEGNQWSKQVGGEEVDWGLKNRATFALFRKLKASGLKCVRIPISWHNHVDSEFNIDPAWMDHVQMVVNKAYGEGLFVIINIHHDNYKGIGNLGTQAGFTLLDEDYTQSEKFVKKIWAQIAERFKNYDAHLIFEVLNEPRIIGGDHEWNCPKNWKNCDVCNASCSNILKLNQAALDTIRDTSGNNYYRFLMIPPYVAAPYAAINGKNERTFSLPRDNPDNRLILSVHMYSPYEFAMANPGHKEYNSDDYNALESVFTDLNNEYSSKEIPVVIGEMGATNRNNFEERRKWFEHYLSLCNKYKIAALLWDNGNEINSSDPSEAFGFINRKSNSPDWFAVSRVSELIAAAVDARTAVLTSIWTGSQDIKHWNDDDGVSIEASKFSNANDSSYLLITVKKGAECSDQSCSNDYSMIQPVLGDWSVMELNIATDTAGASIVDSKQLDITQLVSDDGTHTVKMIPTASVWTQIKEKGVCLYGHKTVITKVELKHN